MYETKSSVTSKKQELFDQLLNSIKQNFSAHEGTPHGEYIEALVYLLHEIILYIYDAGVKKIPWYPNDEEKFKRAREEIEKYNSVGMKSPLVDYNWPTPGDIPPPPEEITDEERAEAWRRLQGHDKPGASAADQVIVRLYYAVYGPKGEPWKW